MAGRTSPKPVWGGRRCALGGQAVSPVHSSGKPVCKGIRLPRGHAIHFHVRMYISYLFPQLVQTNQLCRGAPRRYGTYAWQAEHLRVCVQEHGPGVTWSWENDQSPSQ